MVYLKMMMSVIVVILLTSATNASTPTIESLFRHAINSDVTAESVNVKAQTVDSNGKDVWIEWNFSKTGDGVYQVEQKLFGSSAMDNSTLISVKMRNSLLWDKNSGRETYDQQFFYAVLAYLALNRSLPITSLLARLNSDYVSNRQLINPEKLELLKKQEAFLKQGGKSGEGPMNRDRAVLNQNLLTSKGQVKRVWNDSEKKSKLQAKLEKTEMFFSNEAHQLEQLTFSDGATEISLDIKEYLLFDGIHQLPKYLVFHASDKKVYSLRFLSLSHREKHSATSLSGAKGNVASTTTITLPLLLQ